MIKIEIIGKRAELERRNEKFDIIVGDLADPVEGGPCYQLYTKSFYERILKPKLNVNGIFVTQVGFSLHFIFIVAFFFFFCRPWKTKILIILPLYRLDLQAFLPTKRSSLPYTTLLSKSSSVSSLSLYRIQKHGI